MNANFLGVCILTEFIFWNPNFKYNRDNYEMLIEILHFFKNRNVNIIMGHFHNGNVKGLLVV